MSEGLSRLNTYCAVKVGVKPFMFLLACQGFPAYQRAMQTAGSVIGPVSWERMSEGIEKVKDRLRCAAGTLDAAGIEYAVIGGYAVAAWVSRVDDSVVRNTRGGH